MSGQQNCCSGYRLIFGAIGSAIRPGRLFVAVFCLALLVGGGQLWDACAGPITDQGSLGPFAFATQHVTDALAAVRRGVVQLDPDVMIDGIVAMTWGVPASLWGAGACWFLFVFGLYAVVVLALSFGLQARFEAIVVAERQPPSTDRLLDEFTTLCASFIGAWITPLAIAALLAMAIMVGSFILLSIPLLSIIGAVLWGIVLLLALGLAVTLLGLGISGALLVPAVAVDGCAGPDAMHRAFGLSMARPLRWLWYLVVMSIGLGLGLVIVDTVVALATWLAMGLGGAWVSGDAFTIAVQGDLAETSGWSTTATGEILGFWLVLLQWLVAGWVLCYLAAASTRAWMLLRIAIDCTPIEDIWRPGLMRGTLAPERQD